MKISFPLAILKFIAINDLPNLEFQLKNLNLQPNDDALAYNKQLLNGNPNSLHQYLFDAVNLAKELKDQHKSNKQAAFFNFELLKYEFKYADEPPLFLNSKWSYTKTTNTQIELNFHLECTMNYKKSLLSNVNFMLSLMQQTAKFKLSVNTSDPKAQIQINDDKVQALWQFSNFNKSNLLNLKLTLNIIDPNAITAHDAINFVCDQPLYVKFHVDNQTLSGIKAELLSSNYKLSLTKERIESGKYFCTPSLNQPTRLAEKENVDIEIDKPNSSVEITPLSNINDRNPTADINQSHLPSSAETLIINF
jgi:hypothetical protein